MRVREGDLLAGKYRIGRVLGKGGMGVVVAAHHMDLDEQVAIKFLLPEALCNAEAVARFEREARAVVKIRSEHVSRVTDVGRLEAGEPYIVMELLRGLDLAELLEQRGPLTVADVADYLLQAGEAIAEAHSLGIVHRDLKPQNLYLTHRADGSACVKVLDFGISKMSRPGAQEALTGSATLLGSPLYMAPEQLLSARDIDLRVDIWALGVICFQLLTNKTPFDGETLPQLLRAIDQAEPLKLRDLRPEAPPVLEALILRCLDKDRTGRPASVAEFARELVHFAPKSAAISAERIERLARRAGPELAADAAPKPKAAAQELHPSPGVDPSGTGHGTINGLSGPRRGHPSGRQLGALATVGAVVGGVGLWQARHLFAPAADVTGATPAAYSAQLQAAESPSAAPTLVVPVPTALEPETVKSAGPATMPAANARTARKPAVALARKDVAMPAPAASVDCRLPYFFDAKGNKVFKKECL